MILSNINLLINLRTVIFLVIDFLRLIYYEKLFTI
jgi:hypothetical protein